MGHNVVVWLEASPHRIPHARRHPQAVQQQKRRSTVRVCNRADPAVWSLTANLRVIRAAHTGSYDGELKTVRVHPDVIRHTSVYASHHSMHAVPGSRLLHEEAYG